MKNKSTKIRAISGILAALCMIVVEFLISDVPSPKPIEPIIYPVTQGYTVAPGSWNDIFRLR